MRKTTWVVLFMLVLGALLIAACSSGGSSSNAYVKTPAPDTYANMKNPYAGNADAAAAGKTIYDQNCVACHGDKGLGDGPAGGALNPKPANLQEAAKQAGDTYMHFVISEGGPAAGFSASMAPYKGTISEDDIWKVVTYIDTLK